ncbi:MAG: hypothetical protein EZS28_054985, partial [Streblomastix strix]
MTPSQVRTSEKRCIKGDFSSSTQDQIPPRQGPGRRPLYLVAFHSYIMSETVPAQQRYNLKAEILQSGDIQPGKRARKRARNKAFLTLIR